MKDRDVRVPKERPATPSSGTPVVPWHEEPTGVQTDPQVFRALKSLHGEIQANKQEAAKAHGALKLEVVELAKSVDTRLTKQDLVLERMAGQMDVLVPMKRSRSDSGEARAAAKEVLAEQVLAEQRASIAHTRAVKLKLLGGVVGVLTSGAVLGAVIHWLAS